MAKLNSEKQKKSSFYEEKSLGGLTPGQKFFLSLSVSFSCNKRLFFFFLFFAFFYETISFRNKTSVELKKVIHFLSL